MMKMQEKKEAIHEALEMVGWLIRRKEVWRENSGMQILPSKPTEISLQVNVSGETYNSIANENR